MFRPDIVADGKATSLCVLKKGTSEENGHYLWEEHAIGTPQAQLQVALLCGELMQFLK